MHKGELYGSASWQWYLNMRLEESRIKPLNFWLVDKPLYLLRQLYWASNLRNACAKADETGNVMYNKKQKLL